MRGKQPVSACDFRADKAGRQVDKTGGQTLRKETDTKKKNVLICASTYIVWGGYCREGQCVYNNSSSQSPGAIL